MRFLLYVILLLVHISYGQNFNFQPELQVEYLQVINDSEDNWGTTSAEKLRIIAGENLAFLYSRPYDTVLINKRGEIISVKGSGDFSFDRINHLKSKISYQNYKKQGYTVVDTLSIAYTLGNETKKILSRDCKQAFLSFGGRDYEIFYTTEFKYQCGPYKFMGFPGAVLEVKSFDQEVIIIATKILAYKDNNMVSFNPDELTQWHQNPLLSQSKYTEWYLKTNELIRIKIEQQYSDHKSSVKNFYPKREIEIYEK